MLGSKNATKESKWECRNIKIHFLPVLSSNKKMLHKLKDVSTCILSKHEKIFTLGALATKDQRVQRVPKNADSSESY